MFLIRFEQFLFILFRSDLYLNGIFVIDIAFNLEFIFPLSSLQCIMGAFSTKYIQYDALEFSKKKIIFLSVLWKSLCMG